jgi:hypothetical protein
MKQGPEDFKKHLKEQLNFLESSCEAYDKGQISEAKRIAVVLRTLFHNTDGKTRSLFKLLGKNEKILSTCSKRLQNKGFRSSHSGLIQIGLGVGNSQKFLVSLDSAQSKKYLKFNKWWEEVVIEDIEENKFSRESLVKKVANKDGGAHADKNIPQKYAELTRNNSLGVKTMINGKWEDVNSPELATLRQIGHEVLKTFIHGYKKMPEYEGDGFIIGF